MSIRNLFIRLVANSICLIRFKTLRSSNARFLVFTGTSGKTLARTASAYALRKAGLPVVSPPYGYTNELGIILAALGIELTRLLSLKGMWRIISSCPPNNAYICIELGADWRSDIPWFLKRFKPYGVFITNTSTEEWARTLENTWSEKQRLIAHIPQNGFLSWSVQNESLQKIRTMRIIEPKYHTLEFNASFDKIEFKYESPLGKYSFRSPLSTLMPHTEAFGCAIACMEIIGKGYLLREDFFLGYHASSDRFSQQILAGGAILISDTYKAVPQCSKYVLNFALALAAKKRIAVVSAMHPLWLHESEHYRKIADILNRFDQTYFIGPDQIYSLVKNCAPRVIHADELLIKDLAETLQREVNPETVIVIKTAGRYHMERLVAMLLV